MSRFEAFKPETLPKDGADADGPYTDVVGRTGNLSDPAALLGARTVNDHPDIGGWATAVLRLLHTFPPADPWNDPATWPRWQELLPHVLAAVDPTRPADPACRELKVLLDIAASYRARRGEYRDALALSHQAGALSQAQLGDDHPYTLMSANSVAVWLGELGEHEQARALAEDILTRRRRILGDDDPATLPGLPKITGT